MLQHLTRNVQREVFRVYQTLYEAEIVGQQVGAFLHYHYAAGVELQALFVVLRVVVERRVRGDIQQGVVSSRALVLGVYVRDWRHIVHEFLGVEIVVILVGKLALVLFPDRRHRIERFVHYVLFGLGVLVLAVVGVLYVHLYREADVVGIFLDKSLYLILVEVAAVLLVVGVIFQSKYHVGTCVFLFGFLYSVAVHAVRVPLVSLVAAESLCNYGDFFRYHES